MEAEARPLASCTKERSDCGSAAAPEGLDLAYAGMPAVVLALFLFPVFFVLI